MNRRTFLKRGAVLGGAALGAGVGIRALSSASGAKDPDGAGAATAVRRHSSRPNILVIVVDQLRFPQWFGPAGLAATLPPNIARLRERGVSFARHYTASNDCSPSRAAMLTGLYTHQTGCLITGGSTLDPGFPTWGTMLREHGYHTRWFGKWHVTHGDNHWGPLTGEAGLEPYGFAGGVFPSPDGGPGQGWRVDPEIGLHFGEWLREEGRAEPWCTTVSFVNPHDIAWWYVWSDRVPTEVAARPTVPRLPPNFETSQMLVERGKPMLQRSLQETAAASFGPVPFEGPDVKPIWLDFMNLYVKLQREVDRHVGRVLQALESQPDVAENTVVVFTSDHGEYGGSHGLRGKGAGAYEEAIRVPLIVNDPRGRLTSAPATLRTQMTSSVDFAPLLLTIATGSNQWRSEPQYEHIADRLDMAAILADPSAPGRPYILHATDETVTEFAIEPYAANAPLHVVALRTQGAKYATYSHWGAEGIEPLQAGEETELYDYSTAAGRLELHNGAGSSPLEEVLRGQLEHAIHSELRRPLPSALQAAHGRGFADYFSTAQRVEANVTATRKRRTERLLGGRGRPSPELPLGDGLRGRRPRQPLPGPGGSPG